MQIKSQQQQSKFTQNDQYDFNNKSRSQSNFQRRFSSIEFFYNIKSNVYFIQFSNQNYEYDR